jgi:hypothetical protein
MPPAALRQFLEVHSGVATIQLQPGEHNSISWRWSSDGKYSANSVYANAVWKVEKIQLYSVNLEEWGPCQMSCLRMACDPRKVQDHWLLGEERNASQRSLCALPEPTWISAAPASHMPCLYQALEAYPELSQPPGQFGSKHWNNTAPGLARGDMPCSAPCKPESLDLPCPPHLVEHLEGAEHPDFPKQCCCP